MFLKKPICAALILSLCLLLALSCAKKEEEGEKPAEEKEEGVISYISEEIDFAIFFDEEGTKRSITLGEDETEFKMYIIVSYPEEMQIAAVEYRLELPEGITIDNDKFYPRRTMTLGTFDEGLSEAFPCVAGPKLILHTLTMNVTKDVKNASVKLLASKASDFIGVSECREGYPKMRAASYSAVVNPEE